MHCCKFSLRNLPAHSSSYACLLAASLSMPCAISAFMRAACLARFLAARPIRFVFFCFMPTGYHSRRGLQDYRGTLAVGNFIGVWLVSLRRRPSTTTMANDKPRQAKTAASLSARTIT